jgi:hypothetical protein
MRQLRITFRANGMTGYLHAEFEALSALSRSLSIRLSPDGWARNLDEQLARRKLAGGGRLG